jgi:hypothetical protein
MLRYLTVGHIAGLGNISLPLWVCMSDKTLLGVGQIPDLFANIIFIKPAWQREYIVALPA